MASRFPSTHPSGTPWHRVIETPRIATDAPRGTSLAAALRMSARRVVAAFSFVLVACGSQTTSRNSSVDGGTQPGVGGIGTGANAGTSNGGGSAFGGSGAGGNAGAGARGVTGGSAGNGGSESLRDAASVPDGAVAALVECDVDASTIQGPTDPSLRSRVVGRNGTLEDRCTPDGDLIKYGCEVSQTCGPGPNPGCVVNETGLVRPSLVDCAGTCKDGVCEDRCPAGGEQIVYETTDGTGLFTVRNENDGERYACTVVFDNDLDAYDCIEDPAVGTVARIDGSSNGTCAASFALSVVAKGTDAGGGSQCTLECSRDSVGLGPPVGTPSFTACPPAGQLAPMAGQGSPDVEQQLRGSNGTFTDVCTSDGNLVDYSCRITEKAHGPPWFLYSGEVAASVYDCGGACRNGACISSCPQMGQALTFESSVTGGYVTVRNQAEGRSYGCVVAWDDPMDDFDCSTISSGRTGKVNAPSTSADLCTATIAELPVAIDGVTASCADCSPCKLSCRVTR